LERALGAADYTTRFMGSGDATYEALRERIEVHLQMLNLPHRVAKWLPITQVVRHSTFAAKKINAVDIGGVAAVRVEFEVQPTADKDDPLFKWREAQPLLGWFVVCPDRSWALHEYEFHHQDRGTGKRITHKGTVRYEGMKDGIPLLKHAENWMTVEGLPGTAAIEQIDLTEIELRPSPPEDFTPAAFGLAAPAPAASLPVKPAGWLLLLAALALALAFGFRYLSRRRVILRSV
jgi:hypothetical protein